MTEGRRVPGWQVRFGRHIVDRYKVFDFLTTELARGHHSGLGHSDLGFFAALNHLREGLEIVTQEGREKPSLTPGQAQIIGRSLGNLDIALTRGQVKLADVPHSNFAEDALVMLADAVREGGDSDMIGEILITSFVEPFKDMEPEWTYLGKFRDHAAELHAQAIREKLKPIRDEGDYPGGPDDEGRGPDGGTRQPTGPKQGPPFTSAEADIPLEAELDVEDFAPAQRSQ